MRLYQRVSTHLSYARTVYRDPALTARLTRLVARASGVIYGTRARTLRAVGRFFADDLPRRGVARPPLRRSSALACLFLPALAFGVWLANSDAALDAAGPDAVREAYLEEDFEDYYSSDPGGRSSPPRSRSTTSGWRSCAFAAGIVLLPARGPVILVINGANVGVAAGLFVAAGRGAASSSGLILPHGLLELTAVVVAGGAGLRMGWAIIAPGDRTRDRRRWPRRAGGRW